MPYPRGRLLALATGVLAFPLILSVSFQSDFWEDGRYAVYDVPLLLLVLAAGIDQLLGRLRAGAPMVIADRGQRPGWRSPAWGPSWWD